ncbi:DUF2232 domain-containing protein [Brevibacillus brevis]|uniref:DUF2232 domain-containing protein n=1 Tax=Brevibacillus brevis TaxID=1393 RepID=A0ABY9T4I9_BREBE|nr:DUF2232 domain-containing protein [Brevibacillus brevis]WNC14823.1 DUF2232 domain-containing protein [Brevibacillus brevis]
MPSKTKQLAENALMLGIALVLLFLSTYTVLGALVGILVPLPFLFLGMSRTIPNLVWISLAFTFLGWIITGPITAFVALGFAIWGAVMGIVYTKRGTALSGITAGAAAVFLGFLFMLAFMIFGMKTNFDAIMQQAASLRPTFMPKEQYDQAMQMGKMLIPVSLIMFSFISSGIVHWLARLMGKRLRRPVPVLPPIREWNFPRSLLYYYFIAMIAMLVFGASMQGTFWESAVLNVKVMLDAVFTLQGLSFCLFAAHLYGWKRLTPVLIVCLFIFPFLTTILSLVGIFDLGIRLRDKLETRVKRG